VASPRPLLPASLRGALQLVVQVVLAVALVVVLEFSASRHNVRFDLTPTKAFLLSPYSEQVATAFPDEAQIIAFYDGGSGDRRRMLDLLQQFNDANPRLRFRLADLDHSPGLAQKYGISNYNSGIIDSGDQRLELRAIDEQEITSTLLRLSSAEPHTICFVNGHGERDPANTDERSGLSDLSHSLETQRFAVTSVATVANGVPERCSILVFAAPSHDLIAGEAEAVERYVRNGGQAMLLIDPETPASFTRLLAEFGVDAGNNVIVDEANRMVGADSFVVQVVRFRPDIFEDRLRAAAILPIARTVRAAEQRPDGVRVVSIAGTSEDSWARQGSTEIPAQDIRFDRDNDDPGPLSVAVLATVERGPGEDGSARRPGRLMVFGDSDFASNRYFSTLGNADLVTAAFAVLAQEPTLIASGKQPRDTPAPLVLTDRQTRVIFWTAFLLLPGSALLVGLAVVRWRRRQRGGR
jgi:ABC-type uncharacterized transport system involved in gliding motility auxiliary subunit